MDRKEQIKKTMEFVKSGMEGYDSGHDWLHIERVRKMAGFINQKEKLEDPFIVDITALVHDVADSKFLTGKKEDGYSLIDSFLATHGMSGIKERVLFAIKNISFSSKSKAGSNDPLLMVVQDADRLDAIGAIGIARAFNYGGFRNNEIYNPEGGPSTVGHFYDKLLLLKDLMNTQTAKKLAEERHSYLESFLKQFYKEWNFNGEAEQ